MGRPRLVREPVALISRGPTTEKSGGLGIMKGIWPLEGPRPNVSTEATFDRPEPLCCASRGPSSRQCLSRGDNEASHGSRPPPEPRFRPEAWSSSRQAGLGSEPIIRLPKLPDFSVAGPLVVVRPLRAEQVGRPRLVREPVALNWPRCALWLVHAPANAGGCIDPDPKSNWQYQPTGFLLQ